jgi:hypothetical protein
LYILRIKIPAPFLSVDIDSFVTMPTIILLAQKQR